MNLQIPATTVFQRNHDEYVAKKNRIVVNQGGRGSSKTYSLAQLFLGILWSERNVLLTICRKTLPALRATAMKDFFDIMKGLELYREERHNKTELSYHYRGNEIEFISVDQPQKVRGRKRQYLWMNEANEFSYEDFRQLNLRTEKQIFMDFNPSDEYHWIYDHVLTRNDAALIKSTYLDNPFLDPAIVREIELLKGMDQNYWRIYGLGERGISEAKIYTHWQLCDKLPDNLDETIYGLDFGYNNPTALIRVGIKDKGLYWQELIYETALTNTMLIDKLNDCVRLKELKKSDKIYADSAEPQRIEEIKRAGFNISPADKDVANGINTIKARKLFISKLSTNTLKEIKSYSWQTKDEKILDEPVKVNDHAMDAGRYAVNTHFRKPIVKLINF